MKRSLLLIISILMIGVFMSCTNVLEDSIAVATDFEPTEYNTPYHIPVSEALANLESTMDAIGIGNTRSNNRANWTITNVPMSAFQTQTRVDEENDVSDVLYVVNFNNDEGYAVLSADNRLPDGVIAVTNSGSLNITPLPYPRENPLDSLTLDDLYVAEDDDYLLGITDDGIIMGLLSDYINIRRDSLRDGSGDSELPFPILPGDGSSGESGGGSGLTVKYTYETEVEYGKKMQTTWHQREPYNRYCPNRHYYRGFLGITYSAIKEYDFNAVAEWGNDYKREEDLAAGCIAIAVGQILAYNKYPELEEIIDDDDADWDAVFPDLSQWQNNLDSMNLAQDKQEDYVAKLVHSSGVGCDMTYGFMGTDKSYATPNAAKKFMQNLGYENVKRHFGYDLDVIISQLRNDCPILIGAISGVVNGHAWVVDSYKKIHKIKSLIRSNGTIVSQTIERISNYVHCNWGWANAMNNGWFVSGLFDVGEAYEYDNNDRTSSDLDFDKFFRMVTYDKPSIQE